MSHQSPDRRLHPRSVCDAISSRQRGEDEVVPSRALLRCDTSAETTYFRKQVAADRQSLLCSMTRRHALNSRALDG